MATLSTSNFAGMVQRYVAAAQAAAQTALDFTVGSALLAIGEAVALTCLWLQYLALQIVALTRAATSTGSDLDSWMADFGVERIGSVASVGVLTPYRANPSVQVVIPVGWQVSTADGSVTVAVTLDTTNSAWSPTLNGYVLPVSANSINIPAQATVGGAAANVQAGLLTVIDSPITGIDSVSNSAAFAGGIDGETDAQLRARFPQYLASLRESNVPAVDYAVQTTPGVVRYFVVEGKNPIALTGQLGFFFVIADDGTGNLSSALQNAIATNVNAVRGCGIPFSVVAPVVVIVNVSISITLAPNANGAGVQAAVQTAIIAYLSNFPLGGGTLSLTKLAQIAWDSAPQGSIANIPVAGIAINNSNADLTVATLQAVVAGTVSVTT